MFFFWQHQERSCLLSYLSVVLFQLGYGAFFWTYATQSSWSLLLIPLGIRFSCTRQSSSTSASPMFSHSFWLRATYSAPLFSVINFVCAYAWIDSLNFMPVSINTTLYNSYICFVYLFSYLWLHESFSWMKIFSVALSLSGVAVVAFSASGVSSDFSASQQTIGIVLDLISVVLFAGLQVLCPSSLS